MWKLVEVPCQELEYSMARLDAVLRKLFVDEGKQVKEDYCSLDKIVQVLENNLVMVGISLLLSATEKLFSYTHTSLTVYANLVS